MPRASEYLTRSCAALSFMLRRDSEYTRILGDMTLAVVLRLLAVDLHIEAKKRVEQDLESFKLPRSHGAFSDTLPRSTS
jgi:hypothetical protein